MAVTFLSLLGSAARAERARARESWLDRHLLQQTHDDGPAKAQRLLEGVLAKEDCPPMCRRRLRRVGSGPVRGAVS